jgi:TRAP-type mannitol/chloroaromatic compound transport system substrate-binding protein
MTKFNNDKIIMNRVCSFIFLISCLLISGCGNSESGQVAGEVTNIDRSKIFRWKMVTTWPANFPVFQEGAEKFAEDVLEMSNGRLHIQVYAGGELVPPLQVFDAVSQGTVEMGHGSPYYWAGKVPQAQFFSSVPFGMTAKGMNAWLYNGGGLELWREIYVPFNLIPFPMGNTGVQMGGWFNKKIESLEDIKGLRMRIPGLGGKVLKRAGGNPVLMAGGEIYTALERGTIDATEWVAPFHDLRLGLDRAAQYYYYPGWHEPGTEFELIINSLVWEKLPGDLQKIVETAAAATSQWIYAQMEYQNQKALQELRKKSNVEVLQFPVAVLAELRTLTEATLTDEAEANPEFKRIYEAYADFSKSYSDWSAMSDEAYQLSLIK